MFEGKNVPNIPSHIKKGLYNEQSKRYNLKKFSYSEYQNLVKCMKFSSQRVYQHQELARLLGLSIPHIMKNVSSRDMMIIDMERDFTCGYYELKEHPWVVRKDCKNSSTKFTYQFRCLASVEDLCFVYTNHTPYITALFDDPVKKCNDPFKLAILNKVKKCLKPGMVIAGGAALYLFDQKSYFGDIDIFLYDNDGEFAGEQKYGLNNFAEYMNNSIREFIEDFNPIVIQRNKSVINLDGIVQIVLSWHKGGPVDVIRRFDIDCCCIAYADQKFYMTERFMRSFYTKTILLDPECCSVSYVTRCHKYMSRGYMLTIPGMSVKDIPQIKTAYTGCLSILRLLSNFPGRSSSLSYDDRCLIYAKYLGNCDDRSFSEKVEHVKTLLGTTRENDCYNIFDKPQVERPRSNEKNVSSIESEYAVLKDQEKSLTSLRNTPSTKKFKKLETVVSDTWEGLTEMSQNVYRFSRPNPFASTRQIKTTLGGISYREVDCTRINNFTHKSHDWYKDMKCLPVDVGPIAKKITITPEEFLEEHDFQFRASVAPSAEQKAHAMNLCVKYATWYMDAEIYTEHGISQVYYDHLPDPIKGGVDRPYRRQYINIDESGKETEVVEYVSISKGTPWKTTKEAEIVENVIDTSEVKITTNTNQEPVSLSNRLARKKERYSDQIKKMLEIDLSYGELEVPDVQLTQPESPEVRIQR